MKRPDDHRPAGDPAPDPSSSSGGDPTRDQAELGAILAGLGGEIRRPLERLRGGIDRLLDDPSGSISEAERAQARALLGLCDDLGRLTRECLEGDGPCTDA